jgi:hypothetical protein
VVQDDPLAHEATERPVLACAHAALCAWENHAIRRALLRRHLAGGLE